MVSLEKYISLLKAAMANFRRYSHKHRKRKAVLLAKISKIDSQLKKGSYEGMAKLPKEIQELYDIVGDDEHIKGENAKLIDELNRLRVDEKAYKSKVKEAKKIRSKWKGTEIMLLADLIRHLRKAPILIDRRIELHNSEERLCRRYLKSFDTKVNGFKASIKKHGGELSPTMKEMFRAIREII